MNRYLWVQIFGIGCLLFGSCDAGSNLRDPTKPGGEFINEVSSIPSSENDKDESGFPSGILQGIFFTTSPYIMIDGQCLREGEIAFDSFKVVKILPRQVILLNKNQEKMILSLPEDVKINHK